ncbi:HAD-IA family hydrolase [Actinoplanes sp. TBRC 11911]|uniref:HAD-IA family hydrolase n=1 Tax=Actinoplanes sp. TBRC 11911 TaxID=2729386 RepID=UPI00145E76F1|nr:HAD-IA family hydrolase [Actinoplanes sp. TBRC 11911]NMO52124.1 HAD-IA family hydrolase [Actinoplanes sp. TBRC 11911]
MSDSYDAVVFDLGGVLARPPDPVGRLSRAFGIEVDPVAYWDLREAYDLGLPDDSYWPAVAAAGEPGQLAEADAETWTELAADSLLLLEELYRRRTRLALLSNAPLALAAVAGRSDWAKLFERLVISAREGVAKPDPAVYQRVTALLDLPPSRIAFFDDRADNVAAARRHGWDAFVWAGVTDARVRVAV